jgi:O-methyltransferase
VLILDDYGYWEGSREAADRFLAESGTEILLNRIDFAGRIGVRTS